MTWAMSPTPAVDDQYLLRELAWCEPCGLSLEPAWLAPGRRFYGCRNPACPRPLAAADLMETLVWQAFVYLFVESTATVTVFEQRAMLEHALERVTVGVDFGQLRYQWRDLP